uniref:START domain-containing protein n=1 Tax=Sus scrofa TaxID=9823 RepID=A0A8D1NPS8_PIG
MCAAHSPCHVLSHVFHVHTVTPLLTHRCSRLHTGQASKVRKGWLELGAQRVLSQFQKLGLRGGGRYLFGSGELAVNRASLCPWAPSRPPLQAGRRAVWLNCPSPSTGRCPKPLKNRDVITLRSWLPMGTDYIIMNYSVKHPKYPPRKDLVRAVSIQTGYLIQSTGPKSCVITYLAQVDPKGSLPKWVVNKSSQFLAPKAMKKMYKACVKYPEWKQKHQPHFKPWLHPEQSPLPSLALSELSVQHADSLENIDESAVAESREERAGGAGGEGSDDDTSLT